VILALDLVLLAAVSAHAFLGTAQHAAGLRAYLECRGRGSPRATSSLFVATFLYGLAALCAFL
jgi:hypothetical protein